MGKLLTIEPAKAPVVIPPELIDDFGDLCRAVKMFAATQKRYEARRDEIKDLLQGSPVDEIFVQSSARYRLDISACRMERKVDVKAARKKLGTVVFLKVCSITMKALEAFLLKPDIDAICDSSQSGPRSFVATAIEPEADALAA